ncbi:hypothetical protein [Rummeliibacillus pycnus]|uniref:hypothetical protein n=1 Tax=Rummeliibacillus pycnus TaxID=101070 RepID=UPI0037C67895
MAEIFKFFNSAPGDERWHYASDFADYFGDVLSSGLLLSENAYGLMVKVNSDTLETYVEPGKALIKGHSYKNTLPLYLQHDLPEVSQNRIDRIVLRLDLSNANRYIRAFVKKGTPSSNPVPPELQRDQYIWELSLAKILVRANTATLLADDLTDERSDENLCGIVQSLITVPTSVFQQQYSYWFGRFSNEKRLEFEDWFNEVKSTLSTNTVSNLYTLIEALDIRTDILEEQMIDTNSNLIDVAIELEMLKASLLTGVNANIMIETFQNLNDIELVNGIYDTTNKRLYI